MTTTAERKSREETALGFEWGIVVALVLLIIFFELIPASELGRLSTRTTDSEMEAVETDIAFDDTVEEQEEEVQEEQEELEQETAELVEELDITLSLSEDSTLQVAMTVEQTDELAETQETEEMGPPRFMAVEVFPVCTYRPTPAYPDLARQAGVEGVVTLWIYVNADGTVADVQLYNSSGVNSLDEAAMSAAWNTRWSPARNNGQPVGVWTSLSYNFELSN
ncbi:MAG TPA: energy transducer TonB [Candidatus Sabulitectum sp.]|nr:energy transducer TonB [Candidatus Sabulitectum sp.]HRW77065.1 energy transducer TonB [Candidatus Sabulitectum sp.]